VALRQPFQRQVDAVEQGFGAELGGLLPWQIASTMAGATKARRERRST
jgi:hypothetical protein